MNLIKDFKDYSDDDMGIMSLMGSEASISLGAGTKKDITDPKLMTDAINDYNKMYVKNNEWGGGPVNTEWCNKYKDALNIKYRPSSKPQINLDIHIENYGVARLGYSLVDKLIYSWNWSKVKNFETPSGRALIMYIEKNIYKSKMDINRVIEFLQLRVTPQDFDFESVNEYKDRIGNSRK